MTLRKKTALIVSITLFSVLVILYIMLRATGRDGTHYFLLSSLVIGLILGLTILILLEKQVMSRLTGLINNVSTVGTSGDLSRRVQKTGSDELSLLSTEINRMLEALEKSGKDLRDSEEMFRAISATANDTIILMDDHGNISFWNKAAERAFGYSEQEILGGNLHDLLVPSKYLEEFKRGFEHFKLTGRGQIIGKTYEVTALRKNGEEFPVELSVSAVNLQGKWNAIGIVRDITRRKQVGADLKESEKKYRTLVENINIGVYRAAGEPAGRFLHANSAFAKMFGYDSIDDIMKVSVSDLYQNVKERKFFLEKISKQGYVKSEEIKLRKKDGSLIWGSVTAKAYYDGDGRFEWLDGVIEDITERKRLEEELRALSLRDELTGLYNRRGFLTLAEQQLKVANRVRKVMLLMFADLDDMKYINDAFGHQEGDRALIEIGQILKKTFRESDIVARFGGDEFIVLSLETPDSGMEILANRLREHLDYDNRYENRPYELSVSIGISRYDPENPVDLHDLIVNADKMMYEQKNTRKKEKEKNI